MAFWPLGLVIRRFFVLMVCTAVFQISDFRLVVFCGTMSSEKSTYRTNNTEVSRVRKTSFVCTGSKRLPVLVCARTPTNFSISTFVAYVVSRHFFSNQDAVFTSILRRNVSIFATCLVITAVGINARAYMRIVRVVRT